MYTRPNELYHSGVKGMKWGVRRFQNEDGTLTPAGRSRYSVGGVVKRSIGTGLKTAGAIGAGALYAGHKIAKKAWNSANGLQRLGAHRAGEKAVTSLINPLVNKGGKAGRWLASRIGQSEGLKRGLGVVRQNQDFFNNATRVLGQAAPLAIGGATAAALAFKGAKAIAKRRRDRKARRALEAQQNG